jgi:hypothetical protein
VDARDASSVGVTHNSELVSNTIIFYPSLSHCAVGRCACRDSVNTRRGERALYTAGSKKIIATAKDDNPLAAPYFSCAPQPPPHASLIEQKHIAAFCVEYFINICIPER